MAPINTPKNAGQAVTPIPEQARGNPVYEQTRQDMPLWCCGKDCGRNSRVTVFCLGMIGIVASSIVCLSPHYFHFISLRNDTFYDPEKAQPKPYEYATEANVGLFRYEILEVFEYPWPPNEQRELFDAMHNRELERLATFGETSNSKDEQSSRSSSFNFFNRLLQKKFPDAFYDDDDSVADDEFASDDDEISTPSGNITMHQNDTMDIILTRAPADSPTDIEGILISEVPDVIPGSNAKERIPTSTPTPSPTGGNPNDLIDVEIGEVQPYPAGSEFDKLFTNGQSGAMWAPILASIGLIFASIEFFCCIYKCSWLPTAIFLYCAFMLQLMTLFLFMSEDFCDYTQDCTLGAAGYMSVIAVICYLICQMLVCMTPRPPPKYNLLKKPPVRRKKKKKKRRNEFEEDEKESLADNHDRFGDESSYASSRYLDPYDDQDPYNDQYGDGYDYGNDVNDGYDQDGDKNGNDRNDGSYDNTSKRSFDNADERNYDNDAQTYDDYDNADERSNNDDSQMYDGHETADQRSYDNDAQTHDDYNEDYEEAPSSTSSRLRKK